MRYERGTPTGAPFCFLGCHLGLCVVGVGDCGMARALALQVSGNQRAVCHLSGRGYNTGETVPVSILPCSAAAVDSGHQHTIANTQIPCSRGRKRNVMLDCEPCPHDTKGEVK